jgi:hypothetical protein
MKPPSLLLLINIIPNRRTINKSKTRFAGGAPTGKPVKNGGRHEKLGEKMIVFGKF